MSDPIPAGDGGTEKIQANLHVIPASAFRGIATGLFMMALFTFIWACIAFGSLREGKFKFIPVIFLVFIIVFVFQAIRFFSIAKNLPSSLNAEDAAERKRVGKWFGIIFGAEGLGIFLAINIVTNLGHPDLVIPVIALVVGLHFYPMAKIFRRSIDYYLATWSTIIAICGIYFTLYHTMPSHDILTFVGGGLALATSAYGMFMVFEGRRLMNVNDVAKSKPGGDHILIGILFMGLFVLGSCNHSRSEFSPKEYATVKDSTGIMMANIAVDISSKGPIAWIGYFEESPDFFMASDGGLAFKDYSSAKLFIETTLVKTMKHIELRWDHIRIDPLNSKMASLGADFHEDITDSAGKMIPTEGYFTGLAEETTQGWKLRNVHWSIIKHRESK